MGIVERRVQRIGSQRRRVVLVQLHQGADQLARVGVPRGGHWREALNSDAELYGGGGWGNWGGLDSEPTPSHGHPNSLVITLPALSALFFKNEA